MRFPTLRKPTFYIRTKTRNLVTVLISPGTAFQVLRSLIANTHKIGPDLYSKGLFTLGQPCYLGRATFSKSKRPHMKYDL